MCTGLGLKCIPVGVQRRLDYVPIVVGGLLLLATQPDRRGRSDLGRPQQLESGGVGRQRLAHLVVCRIFVIGLVPFRRADTRRGRHGLAAASGRGAAGCNCPARRHRLRFVPTEKIFPN